MDSGFLAPLGPGMTLIRLARSEKTQMTPEGASRCRAVASGLMGRSAA
jgi:hypothetical protein